MKRNDSEFTNLTLAQVEALRECFDFLKNGYIQTIDFNVKYLWIIKMRHRANGNSINVHITEQYYEIWKNGRCSKKVYHRVNGERFALSVDSEMKVQVRPINVGACAKLING